jgi:diguanylate cyclase (GGDEF)-like protein
MASLDALTQLPNRRSMNAHLEVLVYDNDRTGAPFCVAIGDVDYFKKVNDNYGHDTGDYVLTTLSGLFQNIVKGRGSVARWGGEEFLLLYKLLSYPNKIFTKMELMDEIWGVDCDTGWETLTVHVNRLRKRLENFDDFEIISIRGLGYKAVKKNEVR